MNNFEFFVQIAILIVYACILGYVISLAFPLTFFQGSVIGFMFWTITNKLS